MRLLLDTHIFLWLISGDTRLSGSMRRDILNTTNEVYLSVISLWEAAIKYQLGRLPLPEPPAHYLPVQRERHQIAGLPLDEPSVSHLDDLPPLHRDPFDRILICQAIEHGLSIVTADRAIRAYPVPVYD